MDEQSGESEEEGVKEQVSRKWKNLYQNEVDEETKGADSRVKVKHNESCKHASVAKKLITASARLLQSTTLLPTCLLYTSPSPRDS